MLVIPGEKYRHTDTGVYAHKYIRDKYCYFAFCKMSEGKGDRKDIKARWSLQIELAKQEGNQLLLWGLKNHFRW